jgi:penicillin-binding protein 1B
MATRPPSRPSRQKPKTGSTVPTRVRILLAGPRRTWLKVLLVVVGVPLVVLLFVTAYFWVSYGRLIDAKLKTEQQPIPRIFGRPFEIRAGRPISPAQLVQRLNDVGYAEREKAAQPGEFTVSPGFVVVAPRTGDDKPHLIRVDFSKSAAPVVTKLTEIGGKAVDHVTLEAPLLAALAPGQRRRNIPLAAIPKVMVDAVLSIEDKRFYDHPGVDPIRAVGAVLTNLKGDKPYLVGGSTLTQQIVKNTFLTPEKTLRRKVQEQFMSVVLETRFTKDQILELYLNDVVLGQRGPFEIHGVGEAARIFFGKDVRNITLSEAATIAGLIQSPSRLSPFRNPERAQERRNVVLQEMAENGAITSAQATAAAGEPLKIMTRALENEAPYFVDYVSHLVDEKYAGVLKMDTPVDVYTTLDLHLQRIAQEAVATGVAQLDKQLARRKVQPQVALVAVDPRTGEILALIGGRSYSQSQYNRAVTIQRQPGSVFKPFVYLAAFEKMAEDHRSDITPATVFIDEPTVFKDGENDYSPGNYQSEYDGPITVRRALALSRNVVAIKVAEAVGYQQVVNVWKRVGVGTPAKAYPSIALGVFEASPVEIATAYTLFTNNGSVRPLQALTRMMVGNKPTTIQPVPPRPVAKPETAFLVTNLMRAVLNEGTGAGVRSAGFTLDAAGKTGTTNDLRDAWFVGFTPELLTVVWVGLDDNQPIGLSGSQAALPIWTSFMKRALASRSSASFEAPEGITYATIDKDTGKLATPMCPRTINEAFLAGTAPTDYCDVHGGNPVSGFFSKFGSLLKRIGRD